MDFRLTVTKTIKLLGRIDEFAYLGSTFPVNSLPPDPIHILEIGDSEYFFSILPEQTTRVCTHSTQRHSDDPRRIPFSLRAAVDILRRIRAKEFDLIAIHPTIASVARIVKWPFKIHTLGPFLIFLAKTQGTPVVLYDVMDTMVIPRKNFIFFRKADLYFKRELPQNNWHVFLFTTRRNEDVSNIRRQPFFQEAYKKIRPFPLAAYRTLDFAEVKPQDKTVDLFYVGDNPKTTVRERGMKVLEKLKARGIRVDLPDHRLSPEEFKIRMSRAWLAWSPEGSGWECFRDHEAIIEGAVPVMNYPTIDRYKPLIEGKHTFYYGCEEDDLIRVIEEALADTSRLLEMVRAAREHLRQWYTKDAVVRYMWHELARSKTEGRDADLSGFLPNP
jgi:glycosyltransferase involved in cell wall biosynthesis